MYPGASRSRPLSNLALRHVGFGSDEEGGGASIAQPILVSDATGCSHSFFIVSIEYRALCAPR